MMHQPYKGGTSVILQQDDYTDEKDKRDLEVFLPPVGYVYQRHPKWENYGELVYYGVYSRSDDEKEQYWDRKHFLSQWDFDYIDRRKKEMRRMREDPDYVDSELEDFREQMWKYRINGMWFMNNGNPVYLTSDHWFFLVCWKLDVGYPKFKMPDWEVQVFWQRCVDDPLSMGMCEATRRRQGKTVRAGCNMYNYISMHREKQGGIQSKSAKDAKESVYIKGILNPLRHLWDFFTPKYDLEKGKLPKSGLFFTETNVRGKASLEDIYKDIDELNSEITWGAADHVYYDGQKKHRYIGDEVGKTEAPINVYERHLIVYFCFLDDEYNIIGKAHYTTTVEEITKGGAHFRLLWDASNQQYRDQNGMTSSGLYRFFTPAYKTLFVDKYGIPNEEKAKIKLENTRKSFMEKGDWIGLASFIRKNPNSVKEMFYVDPNECQFDAIRLNNRLEELTWMNRDDLYHRGNLQWVNGPDSSVKWIPNKMGRWLLRKDIDPNDPEIWNKTIVEGFVKRPNSNNMAGIDPFSHNKTKEKKNSMGACYIGTKPDATNPSRSMMPFLQYHFRPRTAQLFYEDMTMTLFWTASEATIESNKIGLINYLEDRGYMPFVKHFEDMPGIASSTATHGHIVAELEEFVSGEDNDIQKCTFVDLLTDILTFDIGDTEKNDLSMAFSFYRIGCFGYRYKKKPSKKPIFNDKLYDVNEIFPC